MSAFRFIACGMVELHTMSPSDRKGVILAARNEAHKLGYWLSGCSHDHCCAKTPNDPTDGSDWGRAPHRLTRWHKKLFRARPSVNERSRTLAGGSFQHCCQALVEQLENKSTMKPSGDP